MRPRASTCCSCSIRRARRRSRRSRKSASPRTPTRRSRPSLANPGNQSGQAGTSVSVQLSATDPNGDTLTYSASGLPSGCFDQSVNRRDQRHADRGGHVQRRRDGKRRRQQRQRELRLDRRRGPALRAQHAAAAEPGHGRQQCHLPGERDGGRRHPVPVGLRRRHAGHAIFLRLDDLARVRDSPAFTT